MVQRSCAVAAAIALVFAMSGAGSDWDWQGAEGAGGMLLLLLLLLMMMMMKGRPPAPAQETPQGIPLRRHPSRMGWTFSEMARQCVHVRRPLLLLPLLMSGAALLTTAGKDHLCALSVCPLLFLPRWRAIK